jgi:hypothetical protein
MSSFQELMRTWDFKSEIWDQYKVYPRPNSSITWGRKILWNSFLKEYKKVKRVKCKILIIKSFFPYSNSGNKVLGRLPNTWILTQRCCKAQTQNTCSEVKQSGFNFYIYNHFNCQRFCLTWLSSAELQWSHSL